MTNNAVFKPIVRSSGVFVAGLAAIPEGKARFFVVQKNEDTETFIGRVSTWIKDQGATALAMEQPDVLIEGVDVGEVLMRIRVSLGAPRGDTSAEFDVQNVEVSLSEAMKKSAE